MDGLSEFIDRILVVDQSADGTSASGGKLLVYKGLSERQRGAAQFDAWVFDGLTKEQIRTQIGRWIAQLSDTPGLVWIEAWRHSARQRFDRWRTRVEGDPHAQASGPSEDSGTREYAIGALVQGLTSTNELLRGLVDTSVTRSLDLASSIPEAAFKLGQYTGREELASYVESERAKAEMFRDAMPHLTRIVEVVMAAKGNAGGRAAESADGSEEAQPEALGPERIAWDLKMIKVLAGDVQTIAMKDRKHLTPEALREIKELHEQLSAVIAFLG